MNSNIEFSSIRVTKAIREAIADAAELTETSTEDFVHMALAFSVSRAIHQTTEFVSLRGESIDEDFGLLKYWDEEKRKGRRVVLRTGGNADQLRVMIEAISKFEKQKEGGGEADISPSQSDNRFGLIWENIEHEQSLHRLRHKKSLEIQDKQISSDEQERILNELEKKYREEKGYLRSEIPIGFAQGPQMMLDPMSFAALSSAEILELVKAIESGDLSLEEIVAVLLSLKAGYNWVVKKVGEEHVEKLKKAIKNRLGEFVVKIADKIDTDRSTNS